MFTWSIIELSVLSALVSLFLDFCMREGHILGWWLDMLADYFLPSDTPEIAREDKFKLVDSIWFKPLGYCVVCSNFWVSVFICLFLYREWSFVLVVLVSSFLVRFFQEKIL